IIIPGQLYELFYWDNDGWISLGQQTATEYVLYYDKAPLNVLFFLQPKKSEKILLLYFLLLSLPYYL
ncbi:MAG: hypothetical protein LBG80_13960, partial [Bacteroidales bacterium]|nr:hypothetical protein [Bacteroidales bacterium]